MIPIDPTFGYSKILGSCRCSCCFRQRRASGTAHLVTPFSGKPLFKCCAVRGTLASRITSDSTVTMSIIVEVRGSGVVARGNLLVIRPCGARKQPAARAAKRARQSRLSPALIAYYARRLRACLQPTLSSGPDGASSFFLCNIIKSNIITRRVLIKSLFQRPPHSAMAALRQHHAAVLL
jgi:hypothetical protein